MIGGKYWLVNFHIGIREEGFLRDAEFGFVGPVGLVRGPGRFTKCGHMKRVPAAFTSMSGTFPCWGEWLWWAQ